MAVGLQFAQRDFLFVREAGGKLQQLKFAWGWTCNKKRVFIFSETGNWDGYIYIYLCFFTESVIKSYIFTDIVLKIFYVRL